MLVAILKNHLSWEFTPLLDFLSKKRVLIMRIIFCAVVLEIAAFTLFINQVVISDTGSYALAASALAASTRPDLKPEIATAELIDELRSVGYKPVIIQKIEREPFSVKGVLIGLHNDSIQVFEYPDSETALREGSAFAKKYTGSESRNKWKNVMRINIKGNLVIFYMGTNASILIAFDKDKNSLSLNNK